MKLADLQLDNIRLDARQAGIDITGISADSRKVEPGFLFFAIAGTKADGGHFAKQAAAGGAGAVAAEGRPDDLPDHIAFLPVANARRALALAATKFFPRQPAIIAAVTGTSGKTSVAAFTRQIWGTLGYQAASIGTIGLVSPLSEKYGSPPKPEPVELARTPTQTGGGGGAA